MKISLKCSEDIRKVLEEVIVYNGFELDENAEIVFIEKSFRENKNISTYITFDKNDLSSFLNFLKILREPNKNREKFITVKGEENFEVFPYEKIQYFEADNNDVYCIVANDKKIYKVKEKLYELEENLDKKIFLRISKSNIVNILNVKEIIPWFGSKLLLKFKESSKTVEVTRTYVKDFKQNLGI